MNDIEARASLAVHRQPTSPLPGSNMAASDQSSLEMATLQFNWHIAPERMELCRRPDGSQWCLGKGGYGSVRADVSHPCTLSHHTPAAKPRGMVVVIADLVKSDKMLTLPALHDAEHDCI